MTNRDPATAAQVQQLAKELANCHRRRRLWRSMRGVALEQLRALLKTIPRGGIECPAVKAAALDLASAQPGKMREPFNVFSEAVIIRSRNPGGESEAAELQRVAVRSMEIYRALAKAAEQELAASNEEALIKAKAQRLAVGAAGAPALH